MAAGGLRIMGIMEGDADPQSFIHELPELQRTGNFPFERLIRSYAFDDIEQAISEPANGNCVKAVLVMNEHED